MTMNTKTTLGLLATLSFFSAVGCDDHAGMHEFFPSGENRKVNQMIDAQSTAGARQDATLQEIHFTGAKLNTLGETKLDLLIPDEQDADLLVYVNVPAGDLGSSRKNAVSDYLHYRGLDVSHIKLVDGPSPVTSPAADGLTRMVKTESTEDTAGGGGTGTSMSGK